MNLTPNDISYLRQKASDKGYNADDLLKVINYESSGRPNVWGGKNNQYFGLFQAGPAERKQFNIDTEHPSAQNQSDGMMQFLKARGYKPGMGLLDLYSTVNAGSPGHYNASDGNGTVASHVAKMQAAPADGAPMDITPALSQSSQPDQSKPEDIRSLIQANYDPQKMRAQAAMNEAGDYGMALLKQSFSPATLLDPTPMAPMQQMNAPVPQAHRFSKQVRGLLG